MKRLLGTDRIGIIQASALSLDLVSRAVEEIDALLKQRKRVRPGQEAPFSIRTQDEIASTAGEATNTLRYLLASVAAISLVVGGIAIMNIMLVWVTERTREIGIRMAIGAKGRHVLSQFLVEAVTLSVVGGVLGVALGVAASKIIAAKAGWPVLVEPRSVAMAFGFAAAIGIFFGFYPARKASRLDPIEALRYE